VRHHAKFCKNRQITFGVSQFLFYFSIFNMAAVRHFGFSKFQIFVLDRVGRDIIVTDFIKIGQTFAFMFQDAAIHHLGFVGHTLG